MDDRGSERFGRYEILAELGRGAMGIVYKARSVQLGKRIAVRSDATRAQGINNWDFSASKVTPVTEEVSVDFRGEFFNLFNRVQFAPPNTSFGGASFGLITSQANNPRQIQFSLRVSF
jgi:hypothetical protein